MIHGIQHTTYSIQDTKYTTFTTVDRQPDFTYSLYCGAVLIIAHKTQVDD